VNCRRTRLPGLLDSILAIVSPSGKMSTKPDQAQNAPVMVEPAWIVTGRLLVTFY